MKDRSSHRFNWLVFAALLTGVTFVWLWAPATHSSTQSRQWIFQAKRDQAHNESRISERLVMQVIGAGAYLSAAVQAQDSQLAEAISLSEQVAHLYQAGRYKEAVPLAQKALTIREKLLGPEHIQVAESLNRLAMLYEAQGEYKPALPLYQRSLSIAERVLGSDHLDIAKVLTNLGGLYEAQGDYGQAAFFLERALAIDEKALGPEHSDLAKDLNNLATLYYTRGDYRRTLTLLQRALEIDEKALGPNHPDVARLLDNLAGLYKAQNDYGRAEPLAQRALTIDEKALGPEHPNVATDLNTLAALYYLQGDYNRAARLFQRALAIWERAFGPEHADVATAVSGLALVYRAQGDYGRAESLAQRALAIREKALGPAHPDVATEISNLAMLYQAQGDYTRAMPLLQRALAIDEKALGAEHPGVATDLNNLAMQCQLQGDYGRATPLYQRALTIDEKALGPEHPSVAQLLNNLGMAYQAQGEYLRAQQPLQRALAIREKVLQPAHPDLAQSLNNLGMLYHLQGDFGRAAPLVQRALDIREKTLGPEHPDVAQSLNNLGTVYLFQGDYGLAEPILERALKIDEKALGPEHPDIANVMCNLALVYETEASYGKAAALLRQAGVIEEKNISRILATGSQQQKQLYLDRLASGSAMMVFLHHHDAPQNAELSSLALTIILQRKGRALDATSNQITALRRRAAPADQTLLDQLTTVQTSISNLLLSNPGRVPPNERLAEIANLKVEEDRLEDAISRRSAEFRAVAQPVTVDLVRQELAPDACLVELFVYRPIIVATINHALRAEVPHYLAYVLRQADDVPKFVDLGEAAAIDADAAKFRSALQTAETPEAQVKELARKLDERVMRPVRKLLGPAKRVFLSPDGSLNLVPFDALVDEDGHYLIENYSFNYLTSGRDLLRGQIAGRNHEPPVIMANPLFDLSSNSATTASGRRVVVLLGSGETAKNEARSTDFTKFYYRPLPGTAAEGQSIGALLPQSRVWTQADATEGRLKSVNRPLILHIATHGFFFGDQPKPEVSERRQLLRLDIVPSGPQQENPMLRSGLILAGANQGQSGIGEDGVLTAQEAAGLNLFGTKLVVLSACETGLGDVQNGAGVYGLRRALVLAGSETQVMSLWQVSDTATRDLMIAYYTRLQSGAGRIAALHEVQLAMLHGAALSKNGVARTNWRHPYYWAAFIPSGSWLTLDGKEPK